MHIYTITIQFKAVASHKHIYGELGVAENFCNPSILEAETGGSHIQDQSGLPSETLSQKLQNHGRQRLGGSGFKANPR
jgi:hypothetical protein